MIRIALTLLLSFSLPLILSSCMFMKPDYLKMISPQALHQITEEGDIFLVDVHIPEQHHIKGTDLFAPFYKIEKYINKFPKNKEAPIYIYCKSGPMGNAAARSLFKTGYTNLYNLEGGAENWIKAGYPVE